MKQPWEMTLQEYCIGILKLNYPDLALRVPEHFRRRAEFLEKDLGCAPGDRHPDDSYASRFSGILEDGARMLRNCEFMHRKSVQEALQEGSNVLDNVLNDYPSLRHQFLEDGTMKLFKITGPSGGEHYEHSSGCIVAALSQGSAEKLAQEYIAGTRRTVHIKCELIANECLINEEKVIYGEPIDWGRF